MPGVVAGRAEPGWEPVAELLEQQLGAPGEAAGGAAVSVWWRGEPVVDVWGGVADAATGAPWAADTLALSFSTTKGVVATALHVCAGRGLLDYDEPVARSWPEFAAGGKERITVRQVLCHEAGLHDVMRFLDRDPARLTDWDSMTGALAAAEPTIPPGTANAYHAITFGFLVGEIVQRVTTTPLSTFVREAIAEPLGLDGCFVPLPDAERPRVAALVPPPSFVLPELPAPPGSAGTGAGADAGASDRPVLRLDVMRAALGTPKVFALFAEPASWGVPLPSTHGFFTARALARLYALLAAGGTLGGVRLLPASTVEALAATQNDRPDLVNVFRMYWRLGYHRVFTTAGGVRAGFGHNGFGGSGAWADPTRDLAVAMTLNRLGGMAATDDRFMAIGGAAVRCADGRPAGRSRSRPAARPR